MMYSIGSGMLLGFSMVMLGGMIFDKIFKYKHIFYYFAGQVVGLGLAMLIIISILGVR